MIINALTHALTPIHLLVQQLYQQQNNVLLSVPPKLVAPTLIQKIASIPALPVVQRHNMMDRITILFSLILL